MTLKFQPRLTYRCDTVAMTLVELLIGVGIGSIVLALLSVLTVFGTRSFASLGNYSILNEQSHAGIDRVTRELRQASGVVSWSTNSVPKWLVVTNVTVASNGTTNAYSVRYSWDSDRQLVMRKSTAGADTVLLEGCDSWNFSLCTGFPNAGATNGFYPATNAADCKLINMVWRCSRLVGGMSAVNTESEQFAQIVLRNKH